MRRRAVRVRHTILVAVLTVTVVAGSVDAATAATSRSTASTPPAPVDQATPPTADDPAADAGAEPTTGSSTTDSPTTGSPTTGSPTTGSPTSSTPTGEDDAGRSMPAPPRPVRTVEAAVGAPEADGPGTIEIVQATAPDDPQDFAFSLCAADAGSACASDPTVVSLDDDDDVTLDHHLVEEHDPGTYLVTQDHVDGWGLYDLTCTTAESTDRARRRVVIDLAAGEHVICTFRNRQAAFTVVQDTVPSSPQDFTVEVCPTTGPCRSVVVDDDSDPTLAASATVGGLAPGTYTATQAPVEGQGLAALTCTSGATSLADRSVEFVVAAGEQVSCTFMDRPNALTIIQNTSPDGPTDFSFTRCLADDCLPFSLDDDSDATLSRSVTWSSLAAGTYEVTQASSASALTSLVCDDGSTVDLAARRATIEVRPGEVVTCTFANRPTSVSLALDAVPNADQDFHATLCPVAGPCEDLLLDDDGDATLPASRRIEGLAPGVWTLDVDPVPAWGQGTVSCGVGVVDSATGAATFVVDVGNQINCTVRASRTSLTIVQDSDPNGPQHFDYTACVDGAVDCTSFALDDDTDPALSNTAVLRPDGGGVTYTVRLGEQAGWGLRSLSCTSGQTRLDRAEVTVSLDLGEAVTCTFVVRQSTITIVQDTVPNAATDFGFTGCAGPDGSRGCGRFVLDDDGGSFVLPSSLTFRDLTGGETYTIVQDEVAGYGLTRLDCAGALVERTARRATVVLAPGDAITCTFTNAATTLTVVQDTTPNAAQDFTFHGCRGTADPGACSTFWLDDDSTPALPSSAAFSLLEPGTYTVRQDELVGYGVGITCTGASVLRTARSLTVTLSAGAQVTCTFTNTATSLTIVQDAQPNAATDFSFTGCAGPGGANGCGTFLLDDDTDAVLAATRTYSGLAANTYSVTQDELAGYGVSRLSCTGSALTDVRARRVTVVLQPGDQVTCTFVDLPTWVRVVQDTQPDGPQDFRYSGCRDDACGPFLLDDDTDAANANAVTFGLVPGPTYSITQEAVDGFGLTQLTCSAGQVDRAGGRVTLVVAAGDQVTCTFVDRETSLTIIQDTTPNGPQDFSFTGCAGPGGANGCGTFLLDDDDDPGLARSVSFTRLAADTLYTVSAEAVPGHVPSVGCVGTQVAPAADEVAVVLAPGDQVTCTFVQSRTTLTVAVDSVPDATQDFSFEACAEGAPCVPFTLDDDPADGTLPASVALADLPTGVPIRIAQSGATPGWGQRGPSDITCVPNAGDGDWYTHTVSLVLQPGEQATCTFRFSRTTLTLTQQNSPEGPQDFTYEVCGPTPDACRTVVLDDDDDPALPQTMALGLVEGPYTITQASVDGWALDRITCTTGEVAPSRREATVVLSPGQSITCTFTTYLRSLTVTQNTTPNVGPVFGFDLCRVGGSCSRLALDDESASSTPRTVTVTPIDPGTYTITQDAVAGFGLTSVSCTGLAEVDLARRQVTVVVGSTSQPSCTFNVQRTTLAVSVSVSGPETTSPQDFAFTLCGPSDCTPFAIDDDASVTLADEFERTGLEPGTYTVQLDEVPPGWSVLQVSCSGSATTDVVAGRAVVVLGAGEDRTCRFSMVLATLTIKEDTVPNGPRDVAFELCPTTGPCTPFVLDDDADATRAALRVFSDLVPGRYTVTQTLDESDLVTTLSCTTGESIDLEARRATITLGPGEQVSCTFVNRVPTLTVAVDTVPDGPLDIPLELCPATGPCTYLLLDDDGNATLPAAQQFGDLAVGRYTVTQQVADAALVTTVSCDTGESIDGDARRATVTLSPGEQVRCTFVNSAPAPAP